MDRLTMTSDKGGLAFTFDLDITCEKSEIEKIVKLGEQLKHYEDLAEKGLLVEIKCHCKDCVHIDCSGCTNETMYCMKHGCYMSGYDGFCAEAEQALKEMEK